MLTFVCYALAVLMGLIAIPVVILFVEIVASLGSRSDVPPELPDLAKGKRLAVVVPAHNESSGLLPTIGDIKPQLLAGDRLLVVADNCSDDTAAVAAAAGAEVIVRDDLTRIGKGYALAWAIGHLGKNAPDFVVFIDADCRIDPTMLWQLKNACAEWGRPIQAGFLMERPDNSSASYGLAEFAWLIKNWARPLGLRALGCPVQLMGTAMIFPWGLIHAVPLASRNLVEDLKLGLDVALLGKAPRFLPSAMCRSRFAATAKGADTQRQRWVRGHLGMILTAAPRLLLQAATRRSLDLLVLALDLIVPPLSLLGLLALAAFCLGLAAVIFGLPSAFLVMGAAILALLLVSIVLAWFKFGRAVLPVHAMPALAPHVFDRIKLLSRLLAGKTAAQWIRTDRSKM